MHRVYTWMGLLTPGLLIDKERIKRVQRNKMLCGRSTASTAMAGKKVTMGIG